MPNKDVYGAWRLRYEYEYFSSTCLPVYLPPVGEPADLPAEGMEARREEA